MVAATTSAPPADDARAPPDRPGRSSRVLTVALRIPAFVAERHLTFDDGVFGASAVAMRAGGQPFRDVFSSQGPLFLPLVWVGRRPRPAHRRTPHGCSRCWPRSSSSAATYAAGRAITDRAGAVIAAVLVSVTGDEPLDHRADRGRRRRPRLRHPHRRPRAALARRGDRPARGVARPRRRRHDLGEGAARPGDPARSPSCSLAGRRLRPILAGAVTAIGFHLRPVAAVGAGATCGSSRTSTTSTWPPTARRAPTPARC